ncbi:radical SAM protein [candidate division FCPU426 bacterium]|nr:radical SAM protein [candidate division FCPU426 bacterium]
METLGTQDGPGLRCVFFLAGCNFRCTFCQNPDTWTATGSRRMSIKEAHQRLEPLLPYLRQRGGGITVSGGEPTLQARFVLALFQCAHRLKLNTALDTNGSCSLARAQRLLAETDIVLLDVKSSVEETHLLLTGQPLPPVLAFGRLAAQAPGRLVIRRVLLPGVNDSKKELENLSAYALSLAEVPPVELIPYHRLGMHKWKELGLRYSLAALKPPTPAQWKKAVNFLVQKGLKVIKG